MIELMFCVAIIGILAGISVPRIGRYIDNLKFQSFSRDLQSFMNYLCQRSVVERQIIYLEIDDYARQYRAYINSDKLLKAYSIPGRITVESSQKQIAFYPDGSIDKTTIKLKDNIRQLNLTTKGIFGGVKTEQ